MKTKKREKSSLSFNRIIQNFFKENEPLPENVSAFRFSIRAQIYENNVPQTITGRIYDNIETVVDDLAKEVGSGRYRLFVQAFDSLDNMIGMTKVEDFRIISKYPVQQTTVVQKSNIVQEHPNFREVFSEMQSKNQETMMNLVTKFTEMIAGMKVPVQSSGTNALALIKEGMKLGKQAATGQVMFDDVDEEDDKPEDTTPVSPVKQNIMDVVDVVKEVMPLLSMFRGGEDTPSVSGIDKILEDPKIKRLQEALEKNPHLLDELVQTEVAT